MDYLCENLFNTYTLFVLLSRVARWYYLVCLKDDPGLMGSPVQFCCWPGSFPFPLKKIYFYNSAYWRLAIVIQFAFSTLVLEFVKARFKNAPEV